MFLSREARKKLYEVRNQYKYLKYDEVYENVEKRFEEERKQIVQKLEEKGESTENVPETDPKAVRKIVEMLLDKVSTKQVLLMAKHKDKDILKLFGVEQEKVNDES
jgi:DNA-directed RNA polymerase subunit F